MTGAAQLGSLLGTQADLNYYTMLQNKWGAMYEANMKKLEAQCKYEEKWDAAFESAHDNSRELTASHGGSVAKVQVNNTNDDIAEAYADNKVYQFDEELSLELAELDIDYDTMKTLYEALVTEAQAKKDALKQSTATALQDTHLLQS